MFAHPEPESLTAHLLERTLKGLKDGGREFRLLDLYAEEFEPSMAETEWQLHRADASEKPWTTHHADHLRWADTIIWIYPTWWSGPPAILKGWVDRIWTNGIAYTHTDKGLEPGVLRNIRRMDVVTTHGASKLVNMLEGEAGKKMIRRGLRALCHPRCQTRWLALYGVDTISPAKVTAFAERVERTYSR